MKKATLFTAMLFTLMLLTASKEKTMVYICNGPHAKVYHASKTCRGLSNCSTQLSHITLEAAKAKGRRACRICY